MLWLIIACEIGFWVFVVLGLCCRYILGQKKIGALLLWCTPVIDLVLLTLTVIDLKDGKSATFFHGAVAYYIGMTVAFGHVLIRWADERFAYQFADGALPTRQPKYGRAHAARERKGWYRHLIGWAIGNTLLVSMIVLVGNQERTEALYQVMQLWGLLLAIDFVWSFSYSVFPKKEKNTAV
ncbi:2TM domain-containing protein [Ectobacillus antri]|uniref:2TM domain-containing protein n=1 Tax=Ectobacillus antri TaxID=2486280 RepID=UPI000F5A8593|nr:2TM domain-containing protein [Ectobacillus antri]